MKCLKHPKTLKHSPFDVLISVLGSETSEIGTATSALTWSFRQYRSAVSGDIGACRVGITRQICNRVTNHGDMGTFSKNEWSEPRAAEPVTWLPSGLEKIPISPWLVTLIHICGVIQTRQSPKTLSERQYCHIECDITASSADVFASNGECLTVSWSFKSVSWCFTSGSWCFTSGSCFNSGSQCFTSGSQCFTMFHDVLLCLTMFYNV